MPDSKALDVGRHTLHELGKILNRDDLTDVADFLQDVLTERVTYGYQCGVHAGAHSGPVPMSTVDRLYMDNDNKRTILFLACGHSAIAPDEIDPENEVRRAMLIPCVWCLEECHS